MQLSAHTLVHTWPHLHTSTLIFTHTSDAPECRFRGCSGRYWSTASGCYLADQQPSLVQPYQGKGSSHQPPDEGSLAAPVSPFHPTAHLDRLGIILCRYCTDSLQVYPGQSRNVQILYEHTLYNMLQSRNDKNRVAQ